MPEPRSLPGAVTELGRTEHFSVVDPTLLMDFMFELVNQYPLLLLEYLAEQNEMEITATSTVVFS